MLLAVDIGNTNIVVGGFEGGRLVFRMRMASDAGRTSDEYLLMLRTALAQEGVVGGVEDCAVSSVVPALDATFAAVGRGLCGRDPFFVTSSVRLNIRLAVDHPEELGADRIVNAAAAFDRHPGGVIVVDFGTATTLEVVSSAGVYEGGVIMPGLRLMQESLHRRTAKLPEVRLGRPASALGRNTVESIRSGVYHAHVGGLEAVIRAVRNVWGPLPVVATGGLADYVVDGLPGPVEKEPDLTLEGLRFLHGMNRP